MLFFDNVKLKGKSNMSEQKRKRGRPANPFKGMSTIELRALQYQVEAQLRQRRIKIVLQELAKIKEKSFNLRRYENNLCDQLQQNRSELIDETLDLLEAILDIY